MRRAAEHGDSGFALLLTLLLVALLAAVVVQFSLSSQVDWISASRRLEETRHQQAIRAGILQAKRLLRYDRDLDVTRGKMVDALEEIWAREHTIAVGSATVTIRIVDEGSLFTLSKLVDDQGKAVPAELDRLNRLLAQIPEDSTPRASLSSALVDWLDREPPGNLETGVFERRVGAETFPLYTMRELLIVPGFTRKVVFGYDDDFGARVPGLADFASARWGNGKYNVNTVPYEVLLCLAVQMTPSRASRIVATRSNTRFENIQQVKDILPDWTTFDDDIGGLLTVQSSFFRADIVSAIGGSEEKGLKPARRSARAHLARSAEGAALLSIELF